MERKRPSKREQLEIRDSILKLYLEGYSASYIIQKTGHNPKTIYKYINQYYKQIQNEKNYSQQLKRTIIQTVLSFDKLLQQHRDFYSQVNNEINNTSPVPRHLLSLKLNILKSITDILDKKFSYQTKVAMDDLVMQLEEIENAKGN